MRTALARLAEEGFVESVPRRGWVVGTLGIRDAREIFDLRLVLEAEAARLAGLPRLRLLEEPQAALYDWLVRHRASLADELAGSRLVLVADVGGEPFAFPITRIARALVLERDELTTFAGHQCFMLDGHRIGVVPAHEVLAVSRTPQWPGAIPVVLLGDHGERYGLAVDRFVGEFDMVVRPLDPRLGKVQDVSASALMDDGTPVLILDTDDLMRSVATQLQGGRLRGLGVTSVARLDDYPDLPTVAETIPGYEASSWYGLAVPKGTPEAIIGRLNAEINAGLADPKIKARMNELGGTVIAASPEEFGKLIAGDTEKWAKVVKAGNIKPE